MEEFERLVQEAVRQSFSGWDFSFVENRMRTESLRWNYREMVTRRLPDCGALLDMGTGGGEFLSSLTPLPRDTWATEGYPPNVEVARRRLRPFGVQVVPIDGDDPLPLETDRFDLVINQHESFSAPEVHRILRSGGHFITQQVGGKNNVGLNEWLGAPVPEIATRWSLDMALAQLRDAGFTIVHADEHFPVTRFDDIGAVVFYLKVIEWQIEGFSVDAYRSRLMDLHREIVANGPFQVASHRFFVEAKKVY